MLWLVFHRCLFPDIRSGTEKLRPKSVSCVWRIRSVSPYLVVFKAKKPQAPCSCRALWNKASGTSGSRWLLLAYVDRGFKLLILALWDIWLSTLFGLRQSSRDIFWWEFGPSLGVVMSTFSLCQFCLAPSSALSCDLQTSAVMMPAISCDLAKAVRPPGKPGLVSWRKVVGAQIFHSCLTELIPPTSSFSFFFFPPSCPFLFGLTLVTDDKAAFPAKPINKLNREKMSI